MKSVFARIIAVLLCALLLFGTFSFAAAGNAGSDNISRVAAKAAKPKITGSKYVAKGKKITLTASTAVTWKSSNKKIAKVSSKGVVKGVKPGTVKITATDKASGKKATWKITVTAKPVKKVKITASVTELDLQGKKSVKLKASATPAEAAQSFTWTSSDPKVAKVSSSGKVTAVGAGTAKITAAATDGSKKKASVTIKVTDGAGGEPVKVGIITLDPAESEYRIKNVKDLKATFTKANGYDASFASSSNSSAQLNAAQGFIADGVKYLLICAADYNGWEDLLKTAKKAGVTVLLFDRMVAADTSLYAAAVVTSWKKEGEMAVSWLAKQNLSEYRIVHIQGAIGSDAQAGRSAAVTSRCKSDSKWTMVKQQSTYWDPEEGYSITQKVIKSGEKFNVIFAENDGMADGAVQALDECGITHGVGGDVIVIGFDCNKWAMQRLLAGEWNADVQCSPFQAETLDKLIKKLEKGEKLTGLNSKKQYFTPEKIFDAKTITQKDVDKYGLGD